MVNHPDLGPGLRPTACQDCLLADNAVMVELSDKPDATDPPAADRRCPRDAIQDKTLAGKPPVAPVEPTVAVAHHWFMSMRGGEKTASVLADMFPDAPIYTLLARPAELDDTLRARRLYTSWLQRFGWIPDLQRKALPLLACAARSLDATRYHVVICSDAAIIKAIRTAPDTLKLCYCHSPMRYVWDLYDAYYRGAGWSGKLGLRLFADRLRRADRRAASSVTAFVANSRDVADRIRRNYDRPAVVIPPPVDTDLPKNDLPTEDYYLVVSELVSYKRNDLAIDACTRLRKPLIVIGTGPLLADLRRRAGPTVRILGWQSDAIVRDHLMRCRVLLFCGREDFGLVPVEAQAAGRPVIAYRAGGATETVRDGETGVFFDAQTVDSVVDSIRRFESSRSLWPPARIQSHARQFGIETFRRRFRRFYDWCLDHDHTGGPQRVREAMTTIDRDAFL